MTQGTTTVDFGTGAQDVTIAVAAAGITAGQLVEAWVFPVDTANNTVDNHLVEDLEVRAYGVTAGVGFSINAKCSEGIAHGVYNLAWVYN